MNSKAHQYSSLAKLLLHRLGKPLSGSHLPEQLHLKVRFQEPRPLIQVAHDLDEQVIGAYIIQYFRLVGCGAGGCGKLRHLISQEPHGCNILHQFLRVWGEARRSSGHAHSTQDFTTQGSSALGNHIYVSEQTLG